MRIHPARDKAEYVLSMMLMASSREGGRLPDMFLDDVPTREAQSRELKASEGDVEAPPTDWISGICSNYVLYEQK